METLEQQILDRVRNLAPDQKRQVLAFLDQLMTERPLSARELMRLPAEERERYVKAALAAAADEDFETFEAYSEEDISG
jgi:hypothetical protein